MQLVSTTIDPVAARGLAVNLLSANEDRLRHVVAVAAAAHRARTSVRLEDQALLVSAAWLHDIGYASDARDTGFHPLDGARYLRAMGSGERLCGLVAHHSASHVEAEFRGLADQVESEFRHEKSEASDTLTYADMITGPTGDAVTVEDRLSEILRRYRREHVVHQSISLAAGELVATVRRVEQRLLVTQPK